MPPKIPGIELDFGGGQIRLVPPLALGDLELLQDRIQAMQAAGSAVNKESIGTVIDATHAALKRNYPEVTREEVGELVDVGNMFEVMQALLDVAGVLRKEADEKNQPAQAVQTELTGQP